MHYYVEPFKDMLGDVVHEISFIIKRGLPKFTNAIWIFFLHSLLFLLPKEWKRRRDINLRDVVIVYLSYYFEVHLMIITMCKNRNEYCLKKDPEKYIFGLQILGTHCTPDNIYRSQLRSVFFFAKELNIFGLCPLYNFWAHYIISRAHNNNF